MPLVDNTHYVSSVGYTAVTAWATGTAKNAGDLIRATAPAVGAERVFVCIVAGTTHATTQPTWTTTRGAKTTDNTVTWQECTGLSGVNGDLTNTPTWTQIKNTAIVLGQIIQRDNGASYQICTTAGTAGNGSEPSFSDTAGTTTADNTVTWTSLGVVGNWTGGQAPHARVANAIATNWAAAGNTVFVKDDHAATQSTSITWLGVGTYAAPIKVICHDGGAYPPVAGNVSTGATETVSGVGSISLTGELYVEGLGFIASANGGSIALCNNAGARQYIKNCTCALTNAGTTQSIAFGGSGNPHGHLVADNVTVQFGNVAHVVSFGRSNLVWKNTPSAIVGATIPTILLSPHTTTSQFSVDINGVDLSAAGSGKTLVGPLAAAGNVRLTNCKLNASVTICSTPTFPRAQVQLVNCDGADTTYRNEVYSYQGTLTTELTIIRTGGASDGTTPISWKVDTTANASFLFPFECPPIIRWNETVGTPITVTIQGIWGGGAVPDDDEIWVEVEYLGTSGFPLSETISDGLATVLSTPAGQAAGSGTWGGSTTKFALSVTFTPEEVGWIYARVKVGGASGTFYIDPKITVS